MTMAPTLMLHFKGVSRAVVSPAAIWGAGLSSRLAPGFLREGNAGLHVEFVAAVEIDVLPDQRCKGSQIHER